MEPRLGPGLLTSLHLRPVIESDLPFLVELNNDPEVMRYLLGRPATAAETAEEWRARRRSGTDDARGLGYWLGTLDDAPVGWWGAAASGDDPSTCRVGYRLRRSAWGRGLATEGCRRMVRRALAAPGIDTITASTMAANRASRRVLEKCGFVVVRTWVGEWDEPIEGWEEGEVDYELSPRHPAPAAAQARTR